MADLKTTYKDDLLDTSVNEKRKYNMIQNADGTVSFEDVTTYSQIGDSFGAADINATNKKVNEVNSNLENLKKLNTIQSGPEEVIGTFNGKSLYRKIYTSSGLSTNTQFVIDDLFTISYVDIVLSINGSYVYSNQIHPFGLVSATVRCYPIITASGLIMILDEIPNINSFYLELIYTKK